MPVFLMFAHMRTVFSYMCKMTATRQTQLLLVAMHCRLLSPAFGKRSLHRKLKEKMNNRQGLPITRVYSLCDLHL